MDSSFDEKSEIAFPSNTERASRNQNQPSSIVLTGVCFNKSCIYKGQNLSTEKVSFDGFEKEYCINCSVSIKDKWVCSYCKEIGCKEDTSPEHPDWVQCCMKMCKRWVHQDCEKKKGFKDIKTLVLDKKYKYICNLCRTKKTVKRFRDSNQESKKADKFGSPEEYRKIMIVRRKTGQINYIYLHSENYQSIEKLLSQIDKGTHTLLLNESELKEDFQKFNESIGRNVFELPSNSVMKYSNSKVDSLLKQPVKKIKKKNSKI